MSAERKKVLELLAAGKITAEDAEKLLDKLDVQGGAPSAARELGPTDEGSAGKKLRYLRVQVERPNGDHVNMRVPLSFMGKGMGLVAVMPPRVLERLSENGIDLSAIASLKGEELEAALRELNVDIDRSGGKKVRIFCE